jgi:hypothetical protein
MITEQQEARLAAATNALSKQDAKTPFLINIHDGRLFPNIAKLRKGNTAKFGANYRPYLGPVKATLEQRMQYLRSETGAGAPAGPLVIDSEMGDTAPPPPFDIGKASRDELITFAATQYGQVIEPNANVMSARKRVREWAQRAGELAASADLA